MTRDDKERAKLDIIKAQFTLNMMERLDKVKDEVKEQAEQGFIEENSKREVKEVVSIINTSASPIGNLVLVEIGNRLERAISPDWPYNFPDKILIDFWFNRYREAFKYAIALHSQKWEKTYLEAATQIHQTRINEQIDFLTDRVKTLEGSKLSKKEKKNKKPETEKKDE